jgi:subtilisin family serine protease
MEGYFMSKSKKNNFFYIFIIYFLFILNYAGASDLPYKEGELLVRFAPKAEGIQRTIQECNQILTTFNAGTIKKSMKFVPGLTLVKLPESLTVENALLIFKDMDGILYVEPNYKIKFYSMFPNDPYFGQLWGMVRIKAPEAWDIVTQSDIIIAMIDTGVDYTHPDLIDNMWHNPGEIPNNGVDDDNNSYIDDIYGYNFSGYTPEDQDNNPMDEYNHGTKCAGIIGAVGDNGIGVTGVCWNVKIMALKIMPPYLDIEWEATVSNAIEAIDYAVENNAKIINSSWGIYYHYSQALKNAIESAGENGVLFVAAAGNIGSNNDNIPDYPSSYDCNNIISVLATDTDDGKPSYSNYGANSVDIGAPGEDILSCLQGGYYESLGGTSAAAPHVAGACALIWSRNQSLTYLQVKEIIMNSVDVVPDLNDNPYYGKMCVTGGRLNLYKAISAVPSLDLTKADNVYNGASVLPGDDVNYTIGYRNPVSEPFLGTVNDVNIIDYLPVELDFNSASGPNSVYDPIAHTVTWRIGTLSPGNDFNSVTLTVKVNNLAEPLGIIINTCVIEANEIRLTSATKFTDVNSWKPDIIYVNKYSPSWPKTGMSWKNAYLNLQDALDSARSCDCNEIWVSAGTYYTHTNTDPSYWDVAFELVDGVALYGGFAGNETSRSQRNWLTNQTILDGDINNDGDSDTNYLVKAANVGPATIIDGFTITMGYYAGILVDGASPIIRHNRITKSSTDGIYCNNGSSVDVINCEIQNNDLYGIDCEDSNLMVSKSIIEGNNQIGIYNRNSSSAIVANNIIRNNGGYGIEYHLINQDTFVEIKNNWIFGNSIGGINLNYVDEPSIILNNTIINNNSCGISSYNSYSEAKPNIINCIIWGNNDVQLYPTDPFFNNVTYSCIQGGYDGEGNIDSDPCFVSPDANNYHLSPNSHCIDKGDPDFTDSNETDIDGEPRIIDGNSDGIDIVDMGADEFFWSPADFDRNEIVNFLDYAVLASAWLTSSGQLDYNSICDISIPRNNIIDANDLARLCDNWLWQPPWNQSEMMMGAGYAHGAGFTESLSITSPPEQLQIELQSDLEPLQPEPQPHLTEEDIQDLVDWLEQLWLTDEEVRNTSTEAEWQEFIEILKQAPLE